MAAAKAGVKVGTKPRAFPVPEELKEKFRNDPRFKRAFEALTPGRQRGYLFHFAGAKHSATRTARIEKAMPAIFEGRGFLQRRYIVKPWMRAERVVASSDARRRSGDGSLRRDAWLFDFVAAVVAQLR
jgi:hypothetical protein